VSSQRGSVLLLVLVATSGLATMTAMLLLSGRVAYELAGLRADTRQAEAMAEGSIRQVVAGLESGTVSPPVAGAPLVVVNGVVQGGDPLPVARFPSPPPGAAWAPRWPTVTEGPLIRPPGGGFGAELQLAVVVGPRGEARARATGGQGVLFRASARAWFRGAVAERTATLHRLPDGSIRRLD
jgi:hypothetical protein